MTNTEVNIPEGEERVDMCLAIQQMQEESEARGIAIGEARGRAIGAEIAKMELLSGLVHDGIITLAEAAKRIGLTEDQLREEFKNAGHIVM